MKPNQQLTLGQAPALLVHLLIPILLNGCALILPGAALMGTFLPAKMLVGNEHGVTVQIHNPSQSKEAFDIAEKHCQQFGKSAMEISRDTSGDKAVGEIIYQCMAKSAS